MANNTESRHSFKTHEAAEYLSMSESWLRQRRTIGALDGQVPGPPYFRIGRAVRYLKADLDKWLAERACR